MKKKRFPCQCHIRESSDSHDLEGYFKKKIYFTKTESKQKNLQKKSKMTYYIR